MKRSNVNPCPHKDAHKHTIRTSDGRTALLCDDCLAAMESRLADPLLIRGMLKSTMSTAELVQMRHERDDMVLERKISDAVAGVWMVAGFPQRLALPAQGGM